MRSDGSRPRKLTAAADNEAPSWSPDGTDVVFVHDPDGPLFSGVGCFAEQCPVIGIGGPRFADIWLMRRDGSARRRLIPNAGEPVYRPR
jgi:Tol biopolymer transport system component